MTKQQWIKQTMATFKQEFGALEGMESPVLAWIEDDLERAWDMGHDQGFEEGDTKKQLRSKL